MFKEVLIIFIITLVFGIAAELHSRIQQKQIMKPRTRINLYVHYLIMIGFLLISCTCVAIFWNIYAELELQYTQKLIFLFVSGVVFISPVIYIAGWRYPEIVEKMESWRKS